MPSVKKQLDRQIALKLLGFLKNAYDDYLGARTLLNHKLYFQGMA